VSGSSGTICYSIHHSAYKPGCSQTADHTFGEKNEIFLRSVPSFAVSSPASATDYPERVPGWIRTDWSRLERARKLASS